MKRASLGRSFQVLEQSLFWESGSGRRCTKPEITMQDRGVGNVLIKWAASPCPWDNSFLGRACSCWSWSCRWRRWGLPSRRRGSSWSDAWRTENFLTRCKKIVTHWIIFGTFTLCDKFTLHGFITKRSSVSIFFPIAFIRKMITNWFL
jgi:hypothetical protein